MNEISFLKLKQNRKDLLEAHKKNNFTDGIRALLTDLYPDTAHFIYELLQNAEDMFAKNVVFKLYDDRLEFIHDGTKRNFNLKDIDAITNIGHNAQKKNDPTSIGKFGVGFKAVFAYTSTPEIHSGNYHFKIKEYFLPDDEDVKLLETEGKTIFVFPFDNPKKLPEQAFKEILKGLREIDDSTLLFLKYIQNITYFLPNGEKGYVSGEEKDDYFYKIKYQHNLNEEEKESNWLRFIKNTEIIDEQNNLKHLNIGIAFSLQEKNNEYKIIPIQGKTYIYFPAVKENSNLFFHINAPFASTVARDSLRDIKENYNLVEKIGQLIYDSLDILKERKLINNSLFKTLPNGEDNISEMYQIILKYIKKAFTEKKLLQALNFEKYGYLNSKEALIGRNNFQKLFTEEILEKLFTEKVVWISNPPSNQREDKFLSYLEIFNLNYNKFFDLILNNKIQNILEDLKKYSVEELRIFYSILYEINEEKFKRSHYSYFSYEIKTPEKDIFLKILKSLDIIKTTKGMVKADNALFLPENVEAISTDNAFVVKELYDEKNYESSKQSKLFLTNLMNIREYSIEVEIEKILKKIEGKEEKELINNKEYFKDILDIAKYLLKDNYINIRWEKYKFLLCEEKETIIKNFTSDILVTSKEINNDLEMIAHATYKKILTKKYKEIYSEEEYEIFKSFLKKINLEFNIKIEKINCKNNPLFYLELNSSGRETNLGINYDYTIFEIANLLDLHSVEFSKMLWEYLNKNNCSYYAKARYSPNAKAEIKNCDSTLFYYLKKKKWILGKDNQWYTPLEINLENLSEIYQNYLDKELLEKLDFAYNQKKEEKEKEEQNIKKKAIEEFKNEYKGCIIIETEKYTLEEKESLTQFLKDLDKKSAKKKESESIDIKESFNNLTKENTFEEFDEEFTNNGIVKNITKREESIEKLYKEKKSEKIKNTYKRLTKISKSSNEEKEMLLNEYNGKCQICETSITSYNNKKIFYATNILDTQDFTDELRNTVDIGWNSLSLCPNCYTKYKNCSKDFSTFLEQVKNTEVIPYDDKRISIKIKLEGIIQYIRYTPRHFLTLKKVINLLEEK